MGLSLGSRQHFQGASLIAHLVKNPPAMLLLLLLSRFESCPTLCDPIDGSPPGSPILGIL